MSADAAAPVRPALVEGAAFPLFTKALASLLVGALAFWGLRSAALIDLDLWPGSAIAAMALALALVALCYYWILRSRTAIDADMIEQTWIWPKKVARADITQVKFVYIPYLSWLIAPRLIVRVRSRGLFVFHAAEPQVLAAFARLSLNLD